MTTPTLTPSKPPSNSTQGATRPTTPPRPTGSAVGASTQVFITLANIVQGLLRQADGPRDE